MLPALLSRGAAAARACRDAVVDPAAPPAPSPAPPFGWSRENLDAHKRELPLSLLKLGSSSSPTYEVVAAARALVSRAGGALDPPAIVTRSNGGWDGSHGSGV